MHAGSMLYTALVLGYSSINNFGQYRAMQGKGQLIIGEIVFFNFAFLFKEKYFSRLVLVSMVIRY